MPDPQPDNLLEVRDLSLFRGERCLFVGLSFTVSGGQVLQLVGDNGSGKTSLLRALSTLAPIEAGEILWRGKPIKSVRDNFLAELSYAGHSDAIKLELTPVENAAFYASLGVGRSTEADAVIDRVGLSDQRDLPCRLLSAGQRRRVSLSRLLINNTVLWLLDEPLTALDVKGRELVAGLIAAHVESGGAVIFTTHQPLVLDGIRPDILDLNGQVGADAGLC